MNNFPLLPYPRHLETTGNQLALPLEGSIAILAARPEQLLFTAREIQRALLETGATWSIQAGEEDGAAIRLHLLPGAVAHAQGYELTITAAGISLVAGDEAGLFYGAQTVRQLLRASGRELPTLRCHDHPDFLNRGVMLDVSRDKVPTMDTLCRLIDLFASWKLNQLQLYTEHTFAYRRHPVVWANASPLTGEDILDLDAYCRQRHIELVPNQNSFGHMRPWLIHDEYNHLAECPDGCDTYWGYFDKPFTLNPGDPGSLELVRDLYDELLPHFSSRQINVGCDETIDLGQGRSAAAVATRGAGVVYLEFLQKIHREVTRRGRVMQFWGDIILKHPELVPELPEGVIALEWGYEADHDFAGRTAVFAHSGRPFYVCPGTSSWNSIGGRPDNARQNLKQAAAAGLAQGAAGYLITDWGDNGHWQPLPISYLGFGYGAGVAWSYQANEARDEAPAVSRDAFNDTTGTIASITRALGQAHKAMAIDDFNGTILFRALQATPDAIAERLASQDQTLTARLEATQEALDEAMAGLTAVQLTGPDAATLERELNWVAAMLHHSCQRIEWMNGAQKDKSLSRQLATAAPDLLSEFAAIWHARNRPGGFTDSRARLAPLLTDYTAH